MRPNGTRRGRWLLLGVAAGAILTSPAVAACAGQQEAGTPQVEVFGPYNGRDADQMGDLLAEFGRRNGIAIRYTGTGSFSTDLRSQVLQTADPPDIAIVPQPGLVAEFAASGDIIPLPTEVVDVLDAAYAPRARALGEVDGTPFGVPFRTSVKSLVWYRPDELRRRGLAIPTTLDELERMTEQISGSGVAPWCLGIEAEAATGWAATDWTEELVLRLAGPAVYDSWIDGTTRFADPPIREAYEEFRRLVLAPGEVAGGITAVVRTPVSGSIDGLFADPPECLLHRQASFAYAWLPEGTDVGPDGDVDTFVLPGVTDEPAPLELGVDLAVAFDDRPEVAAVLQHLARPESTRAWTEAGGFVKPTRLDAGLRNLGPLDRTTVDLLSEPDRVLRVDASDAMPPAIGSTVLLQQISGWVAGSVSYDDLATAVDAARADPPSPSG